MALKASEVIKQMEERGENQFMLLYRDEEGNMKSLAYQNLMFFQPVAHKQYRILGKPSEILEIVDGLKSGKLKLVGKGYYSRPITFK